MINLVPSKSTSGLIVLCAILSLLLLYQCGKVKRTEDVLQATHEKATYWKDKHGRSNAEVRVIQLSYAQLKAIKQDEIDSLSRALQIRPRSVTKYQTVTTVTTDTVVIRRGKIFGDEWAKFQLIGDDKLGYSFRDSLALVTHRKSYGFLHLKRKYVTRAISFNPHTTLTGITSTEIVPRDRKVTLGIFAGYGLYTSGGVVRTGFGAGVGVNFRIF